MWIWEGVNVRVGRTRKKKSLQKNADESVTNDNEEESGNAGYAIRMILAYSAIGLLIAFTSGYFWWAGLILFVLFTLYSLFELLFNGFIAGIVILILYVTLKYVQRMGFRLNNFERAKAEFMKVAKLSSALIAVNFILILILVSLGYYLFGVVG